MTYATAEDLGIPVQTLIWLTTEPEDQSTVPHDATIAAALAGAVATIHGFLRNRFASLPLADPEGELRDLQVAIARYRLYCARPTLLEQQPTLRQNYEDALKALADYRDGKRTLAGAATDLSTPAPQGARLQVAAPARTFTDETWARYG